MKRESEEMVFTLLVLVAAGIMQRGGAAPTTEPRDPSLITPGWWWYWFPAEVNAQYASWQRRSPNRTKMQVRKVFGGPSVGATVIVFQVSEQFRWTLPGLPERAPRGADTDLSDVAGVIPSPPSALRKMVEAAAKATWEYLRELYEGRRPPREPFPL